MAQVESARMVTPEAVALEFRTANLGSRILAYLLDMVIVALGILLIAFAAGLLVLTLCLAKRVWPPQTLIQPVTKTPE